MTNENRGCFLGSAGAGCFVNHFDSLLPPESEGWYTYILKGGPGTGKSTLMKQLARSMEKHDIPCERVFCASDPDSLDAVVFPCLTAAVVDGTAPHEMEPAYPGVDGEIVNLGLWQSDVLQANGEKIRALTDKNRDLHRKSRGYLEVCFSLYRRAAALERQCLNTEKIKRYAARLGARYFDAPAAERGKTHVRLMEAVTPKGFLFAADYAAALCPKAVILHDEFGSAAAELTEALAEAALQCGWNVTQSPSLFGEGIRHLIVPELGFGCFTSDRLCTADIPNARHIHAARFTDAAKHSRCREKLKFLGKSAWEMLEEACLTLQEAGEVHNELEALYAAAMDFDAVGQITEELFQKLWARSWREDGEISEDSPSPNTL